MARYSQNATTGGVIAYLVDATGKPASEISTVVNQHKEILSKGIRARSFANYVGDKIAAAAGLEFRDDFDPDADDFDPDADDE